MRASSVKTFPEAVPQEWIAAAEMESFTPGEQSFTALAEDRFPISVVSVDLVQPPKRKRGVVGLNRERSISILNAFRMKAALPAIEVDEAPNLGQYRYRVRDGYHRFHLAVAVGYSKLPVSVRPYFDIDNC